MIYLFDQLADIDDSMLAKILSVLPSERREKTQAYRYQSDKIRSAVADLLLVYGVRQEYGIFEQLDFVYGENGKPYLARHPEIFFNISHCMQAVVCAISEQEIGIDIEDITEYDEDLATHIANQDELTRIENADHPEVEFAKLWTSKESRLKQTGEGLHDDLKGILINNGF